MTIVETVMEAMPLGTEAAAIRSNAQSSDRLRRSRNRVEGSLGTREVRGSLRSSSPSTRWVASPPVSRHPGARLSTCWTGRSHLTTFMVSVHVG